MVPRADLHVVQPLGALLGVGMAVDADGSNWTILWQFS